jgi:glycine/D-amino acid oxidase-like deaminating enzyme
MNWGVPPWTVDFAPQAQPLPAETDFAVIGGGFAGMAAAAWLRRIAGEKTVVLLEASRLGSGASGRTGGIALNETAAGQLPGLGEVLTGYRQILTQLEVESDFQLNGVYEISHRGGRSDSPIAWEDSGTLRVVRKVPGGTVNPGKVVSGLGRAASRLGVVIRENTRVEGVEFSEKLIVRTAAGELRARRVLLATNAESADLSGLAEWSWASFTLAVLTEPLPEATCAGLGLDSCNAFYTVDLPYLWGRRLADGAVIFGSGLIDIGTDQDLAEFDIARADAAHQFASLERRVRGLHPLLANVRFSHRWGGPIRFGDSWQLFFDRHPRSGDVLVLNGLGGDGVTLSIFLGRWAAEVLAGRSDLPPWGKIGAPR